MYMNFFAPLFRSVLGHVDDVLVYSPPLWRYMYYVGTVEL